MKFPTKQDHRGHVRMVFKLSFTYEKYHNFIKQMYLHKKIKSVNFFQVLKRILILRDT
jgi:hypothetical protein